MSRLARNPISIPEGVTVEIKGQDVKAKGAKGELSLRAHDDVTVKMEETQIKVDPVSNSRQARALWGTTWSNVRNILVGVSEGYTKNLELKGVGYRAQLQGSDLVLQLGFSHEVRYPVPAGIQIVVDKQTLVSITGIDKQKVGQVAAEIRSYRKPEPYKGKGVHYQGEQIFRKEGKKK